MAERPIGVFDSGIGGLTVVDRLMDLMPAEEIVYFGDSARVPYGTKSVGLIRRLAAEDTRFLLRFEPKIVVIACHTASSLAADSLRGEFPGTAFADVVTPGVRKALGATRNRRIGVIGTPATVKSGRYRALLSAADPAAEVFAAACPLFVPLAEEGWTDHPVSAAVAEVYLAGLRESGVDTVILGCTHYPLLRKVIGEALGPGVALVDPAEETAADVRDRLAGAGVLREGSPGRARLFFSDIGVRLRETVARFMDGRRVEIEAAPWAEEGGCTR